MPNRVLAPTVTLGRRFPALSVSTGRVLLAFKPAAEQEQYVRDLVTNRLAWRTVTTHRPRAIVPPAASTARRSGNWLGDDGCHGCRVLMHYCPLKQMRAEQIASRILEVVLAPPAVVPGNLRTTGDERREDLAVVIVAGPGNAHGIERPAMVRTSAASDLRALWLATKPVILFGDLQRVLDSLRAAGTKGRLT